MNNGKGEHQNKIEPMQSLVKFTVQVCYRIMLKIVMSYVNVQGLKKGYSGRTDSFSNTKS